MPPITKKDQLLDKGKKKVKLKDLPLTKWPISKLTDEADKLFSIFIRKRDSDEFGEARCITCPTKMPWQHMSDGHFINRGTWQTRFNEKNNNVQCKKCNFKEHYDSSRKAKYATMLVRKWGVGVLDELDAIASQPFKDTVTYKRKVLIEVIEKYKV